MTKFDYITGNYINPCWRNYSHFKDVDAETRKKACELKRSDEEGWRIFGIFTTVLFSILVLMCLGHCIRSMCCDRR
jgi:hypothetical protein